jgi:hypothetical protein
MRNNHNRIGKYCVSRVPSNFFFIAGIKRRRFSLDAIIKLFIFRIVQILAVQCVLFNL